MYQPTECKPVLASRDSMGVVSWTVPFAGDMSKTLYANGGGLVANTQTTVNPSG